jgi:hypothetical protein
MHDADEGRWRRAVLVDGDTNGDMSMSIIIMISICI